MKHSTSIEKIAPALVAAQAAIGPVTKDRTNTHFKNEYATLDAIIAAVKPTLAANGLAIVQGAAEPHTDSEGRVTAFSVQTMLVHTSGEWMQSSAVMPIVKVDPQGAGAAITYGRRYSLSALLALATEDDDDGNAASYTASNTPAARPASTSETGAPPARSPARASSPAKQNGATPSCPKCGGSSLFDNRAENDERAANGQTLRPDWKCKARGCDGVIWRPKVKAAAPEPDFTDFEGPYNDDENDPFG